MFEKQAGVIAALPDGDAGRLEVWAAKPGTLNRKLAEEIIALDKDFKILGFASKTVAPAGVKGKGSKRKTL